MDFSSPQPLLLVQLDFLWVVGQALYLPMLEQNPPQLFPQDLAEVFHLSPCIPHHKLPLFALIKNVNYLIFITNEMVSDVCLPDWRIKNAINAPLIKTTGDTDLTWRSAHVHWLKHWNGTRLCHAHRLCLILCNIVLVVDGHILTCLKLKIKWGCQFLIWFSKSYIDTSN